jgi:hypothetical protein
MGSGSGTHDLGPLVAEPLASPGSAAGAGTQCLGQAIGNGSLGGVGRRRQDTTLPGHRRRSAPERAPGTAPAAPGDQGAFRGVVDRLDAGRGEEDRSAVGGAVDLKHRGLPDGRHATSGRPSAGAGVRAAGIDAPARRHAAGCASAPLPGTRASVPFDPLFRRARILGLYHSPIFGHWLLAAALIGMYFGAQSGDVP